MMRYRGKSVFDNLANEVFRVYRNYKALYERMKKNNEKCRMNLHKIYEIACPKDSKGIIIDYDMGYNDALKK